MPSGPNNGEVWLVNAHEHVIGLDGDARPLRFGQLARQLGARGQATVIWASTFNHPKKMQRTGPLSGYQMYPGVTVELLPAPAYKRNRSLARVRHNHAVARSFGERAAVRGRPAAVIACLHPLELAEAAATYALANNVPLVIDVVDCWPDVYLSIVPPWVRPALRLALFREYARARRVLRSATSLTAVSATYLSWAHALAQRGPLPGDAMFPLSFPDPSGVELAQAEARRAAMAARCGIQPGQCCVTFLGMFTNYYDLAAMVDAARVLERRGRSDIRVVIAGDGDRRAALIRGAADLSTVSFPGWLDRVDAHALLSLSHVGLAAYAPDAIQSLPYKPFEYMAHGLPIINSLTGELQALLANAGAARQYQAGSGVALADAIAWFADHRAEAATMGNSGKAAFRANYAEEQVYGRFADAVAAVASGTGA